MSYKPERALTHEFCSTHSFSPSGVEMSYKPVSKALVLVHLVPVPGNIGNCNHIDGNKYEFFGFKRDNFYYRSNNGFN